MANSVRKPPQPRTLTCGACGVEFSQKTVGSKLRYCVSCRDEYYRVRRRAVALVANAVAFHKIPPARDLNCVDCAPSRERKAQVYDHRDYSRPLEVEPVCQFHNCRRGPAKWTASPNFFLPKKPVSEISLWVSGEGDAGALL